MSGRPTPTWLPAEDLSARVADAFSAATGAAPDGVWAAPGRVNVIGEHVDYNAGLCLPVALPHRTFAAVRRRDDDEVLLASAQRPDQVWRGRLDDIAPGLEPQWAAYLAGVLWALREAGHDVPGVDVVVDSAVPVGAGLSSSAALECALAVGVADLAGLPGADADDDAGRAALAAACVRAENEVAMASTGGLDQAISLRGREGHALLLDTRDDTAERVPFDLAGHGLALLVVDTRAEHELVGSEYAHRRADCEEAAGLLGVTTLREVGPGGLADALDRLADHPRLVRRVRHVVTEITRVSEVAALLATGRPQDAGPALDASHASLRDDYEVSCTELDLAVESARAAGALGARMTGGGFGGSAVALVPAEAVEHVAGAVAAAFSDARLTPPAFLVAAPAGPAGRAG